MRAWLLALAGLVAWPPGGAVAREAVAADVEQMTQLFDGVCLRAFPDRGAVDRAMAQAGGTAMKPGQVRAYLHDDPGRGWTLARPEATYVVTIEDPPYRACAVRRMTASGFPTVAPYMAAIQGYAAAQRRALGAPFSQAIRSADGLDINASVWPVGVLPDGSTDGVMLFRTDYHGGYAGPLARDAGGVGVEVRFVHQLRAPGLPP